MYEARAAGQARRLRGPRRARGRRAVGRRAPGAARAVAFVPLMFLLGAGDAAREGAHGHRRDGDHRVRHLSGSGWRSRTRSCCASTPHGDGIIVDVLVGTFVGDTGAYLGGRASAPAGWRRGSRRTRPSRGCDRLPGRGAATWCAGLYQDWLSHGDALLLGVAVGARRAARRPLRVPGQARRGHQGRRRRCSAPTAARWTASTPRSSRSSPATTCGWRCCSASARRSRGASDVTRRSRSRPPSTRRVASATGR